MEIIKLNLIPNGVNPTCHCSQYDEGRVIRIELFDGLTPYALQSGDTVTLNVRKPDNTIVTTSLTATQGNTYVNLVTTEQICACVGYNLCDLTITNGSTVIGTLNFIMAIEKDVIADGNPSQSEIKDLNALVAESVRETLPDYKFPSDIYWSDNPLKDKLYRTYDGITTDFDVSELKQTQGVTYWIAPDGNDSNTGDEEHPLTKLSTALAKPDVQTVICKDGVYDINRLGGTVYKGVNIIAAEGAHPIFITSRKITWTLESGYSKVYHNYSSSTDIMAVVDLSEKDTDGDYTRFTLVNSIATVETTPKSYYIDGNDVYVHADAIPTTLYIVLSSNNLYARLSNGETFYIEGIEFIGGVYGAFRAVNEGGNKYPTILLKNCGFSYSYPGNALYLQGCKSIIQGCYASYAAKDGFNYHSSGNIISQAVEINCIGRKNGTTGDNIDNGSTIHDGGKVIRLNCEYYKNIGPNVADVNENTLSFNYGVVAHESLGSSTNKSGFICQDCQMWLDTCASLQNDYDFRAENGELNIRNSIGSLSISGSSKIKAY